MTIILHKCELKLMYMNHLWSCSEFELLVIEGEVVLLSADAETPHLPFGSMGSMTLIDPSDIPTANWFGSCGCAATTKGYILWLQKTRQSKQRLRIILEEISKNIICEISVSSAEHKQKMQTSKPKIAQLSITVKHELIFLKIYFN